MKCSHGPAMFPVRTLFFIAITSWVLALHAIELKDRGASSERSSPSFTDASGMAIRVCHTRLLTF